MIRIVFLILGVYLLMCTVLSYDGMVCRNQWAGFQPEYSWNSGCTIYVHGERIPAYAYTLVDGAISAGG